MCREVNENEHPALDATDARLAVDIIEREIMEVMETELTDSTLAVDIDRLIDATDSTLAVDTVDMALVIAMLGQRPCLVQRLVT